MLRLPILANAPRQVYSIELDKRIYELALTYNSRTLSWYLDIDREDGSTIISGARVINDQPLLVHLAYEEPSTLVAVSITKDDTIADYTAMGERVILLYIPHAEVNLDSDYDEDTLTKAYGTEGLYPL